MEEIRVYLPSRDKTGKELSAEQRNTTLEIVLADTAYWYGGVTLTEGYGNWLDSSGHLHCEEVKIVSCYTDEDTEVLHHDDLIKRAEWIKEYCQQDSVLVSIQEVEQVLFI